MSHGLIFYLGDYGTHRFAYTKGPTTTLGLGQLLKNFWEHGKEKGPEYKGGFLEAGRSVSRGLVLGSSGPGWKDVSRTCIRFNCVLAFAPLNILTNVRRTLVASED